MSASAVRSSDGAVTGTQNLMGSPLYMAPEQMRSSKHVDRRADIWSMGIIVYEMLAGRPPFQGDTLPEICAWMHAEPPDTLTLSATRVPAALEAVIARCLETDPARRCADVATLARAHAALGAPELRISADRIERVLRTGDRVGAPDAGPPPIALTLVEGASPVAQTNGSFGAPTVEPKARRSHGAALAVGSLVAAIAVVIAFVAPGGGAVTSSPSSLALQLPIATPPVCRFGIAGADLCPRAQRGTHPAAGRPRTQGSAVASAPSWGIGSRHRARAGRVLGGACHRKTGSGGGATVASGHEAKAHGVEHAEAIVDRRLWGARLSPRAVVKRARKGLPVAYSGPWRRPSERSPRRLRGESPIQGGHRQCRCSLQCGQGAARRRTNQWTLARSLPRARQAIGAWLGCHSVFGRLLRAHRAHGERVDGVSRRGRPRARAQRSARRGGPRSCRNPRAKTRAAHDRRRAPWCRERPPHPRRMEAPFLPRSGSFP